MTSLPIYSTFARAAVDINVDRLVKGILAGRDTTIRTRGGQTSVRGPDHVVDIDAGRGGVWAADTGRLWREREIKAPEAKDVEAIAERAMSEINLVPDLSKDFRLIDGKVRYAQNVTEANGERVVAARHDLGERLGAKDGIGHGRIDGDKVTRCRCGRCHRIASAW